MDQLKIYFDEDAMDSDVVAALRARDVTVITAFDVGLIGKSDEEQLSFAAEKGFALYTSNVSDFYRLHMEWISTGRNHAGLILVPQQRFSVGEQLRRILHLRAAVSATRLQSQVEFLSNWG